ncbi:SUKH-4 family immunity protein [Streptomyces sp. NPDC054765]
MGAVWAVQPSSGGGRFVNRTLSAYLRSLALLVTTRRQMQGMDRYAAGAAVVAFQEQTAAIDSWALDDDGNWSGHGSSSRCGMGCSEGKVGFLRG